MLYELCVIDENSLYKRGKVLVKPNHLSDRKER